MKTPCQYPDCTEERAGICEICDTHYCEDHGTAHLPFHSYDTISVCWKCGGYNADAE
jgi:hypothetical protein